MADETMFERLKASVVADLRRQQDDARSDALTFVHVDKSEPGLVQIDGWVDLSAIVRTLLTELRTPPEHVKLVRYWEEAIDAILAEAGK